MTPLLLLEAKTIYSRRCRNDHVIGIGHAGNVLFFVNDFVLRLREQRRTAKKDQRAANEYESVLFHSSKQMMYAQILPWLSALLRQDLR